MDAFVCYVFAFVLFVVAGAGVSSGRFNLVALGLAFAVLPQLLGHI